MKDFSHKLHTNSGQALVDTLLAIGVAILVLIGLTRATTIAIRNAQFAKNKTLATEYAQEGLEKTRGLRDSNWTDFWSKAGQECGLNIDGVWDCNGCPSSSNVGIFTRCVVFTDVSAGDNDKMEVTVTVSWNSHQAKLISFLTKWR